MATRKITSGKPRARKRKAPTSADVGAQRLFFNLVELGAMKSAKALLPVVDPMWKDGLSLLLALENRNLKLFKFLLGYNQSDSTLWSLVLYGRANTGAAGELSDDALTWLGLRADQVAEYRAATDPVAFLLARTDPEVWDSAALRAAAGSGHTALVELLLPVSDPKAAASRALREAASNGHAKVVERLIPVSNPRDLDSAALIGAALGGHAECVALLLDHSKPADQGSMALANAALGGYWHIVDMLWDQSVPLSALCTLRSWHEDDSDAFAQISARMRAESDATLLQGATPPALGETARRL